MACGDIGTTSSSECAHTSEGVVERPANGLQEIHQLLLDVESEGSHQGLVPRWQRESFYLIPSLLDRMQEVDLNVVVDWSTQGDTEVFNRAFVCPSAR